MGGPRDLLSRHGEVRRDGGRAGTPSIRHGHHGTLQGWSDAHSDGPLSPTVEQLVGFYLIEAVDLGRRDRRRVEGALRNIRIGGGTACGESEPGSFMSDFARTFEEIFREETGAVLATLIRQVRDFDLAEDALQDAIVDALRTWPEKGIPDRPGAWLTTAARRRAIDRLRRQATLVRKQEEILQELVP